MVFLLFSSTDDIEFGGERKRVRRNDGCESAERPLRLPFERAGDGSEAAVRGAKDDADVVPAVVAGEHREDGRIAGFGAAPERGERGGDVGAGSPRERRARAPVAVDPDLDDFGGGGGDGEI